MEQHYFVEPFANAGDLTPGGIPEGVDPNGYVSYTQGFTFDYQRNLASDSLAKQIQRITINQVLNDVTLALQDLQQWGTPEWIDATDNGGGNFGYNVGAILRYSSTGVAPFGLYYCLNGNSDPNPTANPSNWLNLGNFIGSASKSIQPAIAISNIASPAANTTYPCTVTLMPPADGFIDISGYAAVGAIQSSPNGFKTTITITGTGITNIVTTGNSDDPQNMAVGTYASAQVTKNNLVTITFNVITYATPCSAFQTNLKAAFINGAGSV